MTHRALVVPAAVDQPCTTIQWERGGELLALLYSAIGCDTVDRFTVALDGAELAVWVDDVGWYVDQPVRNTRLHGLLAALGDHRRHPVMGTVVITEGATPEGDTQGLRDELLLDLRSAMALLADPIPTTAAPAAETGD